jgi:hypothetical protein
MKIIHTPIAGAGSWIPTLGSWLRVGVKLANHD